MIQYNTKIFALGHMILSLFIVVIYIDKSFQTVILVLALLFLIWGIILMSFSYTSYLQEWLRHHRNLFYIMLIDTILLTCVYLLPFYKNTPPIWLLMAIVPFYASSFGSKASIQISSIGMAAVLITGFLRDPDADLTAIIMVELIIFIIFIGRKTDQLNRLAYYDVLTGLPNRIYMRELLEFYVKSTDSSKPRYFYFFLIDLDEFKEVNDQFGHDIGDRLLQKIAERMQQVAPCDAVISRMGGDEFTVLLPIKQGGVETDRIAKSLIDCLEQPIWIENHRLQVSMSLGVSMFPNDGTDAESIMKKADIAMYEAKKAGRNRYQHFREM